MPTFNIYIEGLVLGLFKNRPNPGRTFLIPEHHAHEFIFEIQNDANPNSWTPITINPGAEFRFRAEDSDSPAPDLINGIVDLGGHPRIRHIRGVMEHPHGHSRKRLHIHDAHFYTAYISRHEFQAFEDPSGTRYDIGNIGYLMGARINCRTLHLEIKNAAGNWRALPQSPLSQNHTLSVRNLRPGSYHFQGNGGRPDFERAIPYVGGDFIHYYEIVQGVDDNKKYNLKDKAQPLAPAKAEAQSEELNAPPFSDPFICNLAITTEL